MKMNRRHHLVSITAMLALTVMRVCAADVVSPALSVKDAQSIEPGGAITESASTLPTRNRARPQRRAGLEERLDLLTKELSLDAAQQTAVRKILVMQRTEIVQAWSDESLPAQMRVAATRAIGDRTADHIRAILNEMQREKYLKVRPSLPDRAQSTDQVDSWINAVGSH
jgi:hypothetical protein